MNSTVLDKHGQELRAGDRVRARDQERWSPPGNIVKIVWERGWRVIVGWGVPYWAVASDATGPFWRTFFPEAAASVETYSCYDLERIDPEAVSDRL